MDYDAHLSRYLGKYLADYGGQCVSNAAHYCLDNGFPIAYANACDWWNHPALTGRFNFILNNPNDLKQIPPRGAIMIWNSALSGSGGAGHIAIFDRSTGPGVFVSCDANWGGATVHMVTHNWGNIIGWMLPKTSAPASNGGEIMNQGDVTNMYRSLLGREPDAGGLASYTGKSWHDVMYSITGSAEYNARISKIALSSQQAAQLQDMQNAINSQNQTISNITSSSNATKQQLQDALAEIAKDNAELTTAHDKITELQNTPPQIVETNPSWLQTAINGIRKVLGIK